jgi:two-component system chemotaxis response regulator CheY
MAQPDRRRILVIDDDRLFLEITSHHLARSGFAVEVASDPRQGLHRAIEQPFDLILLDLMMPELDGEEVLGLLKPLGLQHKVLVVTAHTGAHYRARMRDLGAAGYVQKPVEPADLLGAVNAILGAARDPGFAAAAPGGATGWLAAVSGWVYDTPVQNRSRQAAAAGIVAALLGILLWLLLA